MPDNETKGRWIGRLLFARLGLSLGGGLVVWLLGVDGETLQIKNRDLAVIGLPVAAIAAFTLVAILGWKTAGAIEFSAFGVKLKGRASQIALWVMIFLTIALAIKLIW
jgi:hypothetical protein